jgi:hypothetical protein
MNEIDTRFPTLVLLNAVTTYGHFEGVHNRAGQMERLFRYDNQIRHYQVVRAMRLGAPGAAEPTANSLVYTTPAYAAEIELVRQREQVQRLSTIGGVLRQPETSVDQLRGPSVMGRPKKGNPLESG